MIAQRIARSCGRSSIRTRAGAFELGNATVPAVAAMRVAGIPFDRDDARGDDRRLGAAYAAAHDAFVAITGDESPPAGEQRSAWLEARMPADMLGWWPRTETGRLRTRSADLERLAAVPEIRPLLEVIHWDKRLPSFGRSLLEKVGPDGRLRMDLKPAATKTGRCSCSNPNLQQLPAGRPGGGRGAARPHVGDRRLLADRAPRRRRALRRRGDAPGVPGRRRHAPPQRRALHRRSLETLPGTSARSRATRPSGSDSARSTAAARAGSWRRRGPCTGSR